MLLYCLSYIYNNPMYILSFDDWQNLSTQGRILLDQVQM